MEVSHVVHVFHGRHARLVGGANGVTGFAASTCHPDCHGVGIMIAPIGDSPTHAVVRSSSEFAAPDNQRAFQKAAFFQIFNQCGNRLIDAVNQIAVSSFDVIVAVP